MKNESFWAWITQSSVKDELSTYSWDFSLSSMSKVDWDIKFMKSSMLWKSSVHSKGFIELDWDIWSSPLSLFIISLSLLYSRSSSTCPSSFRRWDITIDFSSNPSSNHGNRFVSGLTMLLSSIIRVSPF